MGGGRGGWFWNAPRLVDVKGFETKVPTNTAPTVFRGVQAGICRLLVGLWGGTKKVARLICISLCLYGGTYANNEALSIH